MNYAYTSNSWSRKILVGLCAILVVGLILVFIGSQNEFPFKGLILLSLALLFVTLSFKAIFFFLVFFLVFQMHLNVTFGRLVIQPIFLLIPLLFFKIILDSILEGKSFAKTPINYFFMLLIVAFAISNVKCYYLLGGGTLVKSIVFQSKFLILSLLFYVTMNCTKDHNNIYYLLKILTGFLILLSLSGIMEYVGIKTGYNFLIRPIFSLLGTTQIYSDAHGGAGLLRISGLIGSPENFGFFLAFMFPCLIGLRFYSPRYRWIIDVAIFLCIITIILSGTRSALLAVIMYLVLSFIFKFKHHLIVKLMMVGFTGFILLSPLSKTMSDRLQLLSIDNSYQLVMRKQFHKVAYDLSMREKWFGTGWGSFNDNYLKHLTEFPVLYESRHNARSGLNKIYNIYLQFLHDLGIFGLIIFLLFWINCIVVSFKVSRYSDNIVFQYIGFGFFTTLVTWTALGYMGSPNFFLIIGWNTILPAFFWMYCGIVFGIYHYDIIPSQDETLRQAAINRSGNSGK